MSDEILKLRSWNVNGIRACERKGFSAWLNQSDAWFVALQEVRAADDDVPKHLRELAGWHSGFSAAERKGYSGVGFFSRVQPDQVETSLDAPEFDSEGRLQIAHFGKLSIANVYFPNGSGKNRDHSRVPYKLDFYRTLLSRLNALRERGQRVLCVGDFNTAPDEVDLARPKANRKTSGFLPKECEEIKRWLDDGFKDTFRESNSEGGNYTWWSQRSGVRARNIGWRIDLALACPKAWTFVEESHILSDVMGSDHCPIGVDVKAAICR